MSFISASKSSGTLRSREDERYGELLDLARRLQRDGELPRRIRASTFADMPWGLVSVGTYESLVIEGGWSLRQYENWVRDTIRLQIGTA